MNYLKLIDKALRQLYTIDGCDITHNLMNLRHLSEMTWKLKETIWSDVYRDLEINFTKYGIYKINAELLKMRELAILKGYLYE